MEKKLNRLADEIIDFCLVAMALHVNHIFILSVFEMLYETKYGWSIYEFSLGQTAIYLALQILLGLIWLDDIEKISNRIKRFFE